VGPRERSNGTYRLGCAADTSVIRSGRARDPPQQNPRRIGARGSPCAPASAVFADPSPDDHPRTGGPAAGPAAGAARSFAVGGVAWTVTERDGAGVPGNADGARGRRCLVFASPEAVRRVWDYPPDWRALPDAALFALSWRT